ncbi:MAG: hypothetical protein K0S18_107 [Anaerocolumna sp.]|jgi:hypothetical protein|nr:hypothetical protein [Anaerocolumna sp.]
MGVYMNKISKYENSLLEPDEAKQLVSDICKNNIDEWRIKLQDMYVKIMTMR